jgi:TolB protein
MKGALTPWQMTALALGLAGLISSAAANTNATEEIAFVSIRSGDAHIFINSGLGTDRQLTSGKSINTQPAWSPDGKRIAFTSSRSGLTKIFVMNRDGSDQQRLTRDERIESSPSWSPDGKSLALFSRDPASGAVELRIVDIATGATASVAGNGLDKGPEAPAWSADSRRITFMGFNETGKSDVWVVERDGSDARAVSTQVSKRSKAQPALSPDGSKIAYVADLRGAMAIMVTDLASGRTTNLTDGIVASHESPRWSQDGKRLLFASTRDDPQGTRADIFVMNADGSEVRNLSRHPHEDFNAQWMADGRHVVFTSLRSGTSQIFAVDLASGQTTRLTSNASHDMEQVTRPVAN